MEIEALNTKTALILASGPIFAHKGVEGASVRVIARAAGANVASVNYHFGTKDKLYLAVFEYVIDKIHSEYLHERWVQMPLADRSADNIRALIKENILKCFENLFLKGHPSWFYTLLYKEMCSPGEAFLYMKKFVIEPEHLAAREIFAIIKPGAQKWEADIWIAFWHGQLFYTATTIGAHQAIYNWREGKIPEDYLRQIVDSTTRMAMALLD